MKHEAWAHNLRVPWRRCAERQTKAHCARTRRVSTPRMHVACEGLVGTPRGDDAWARRVGKPLGHAACSRPAWSPRSAACANSEMKQTRRDHRQTLFWRCLLSTQPRDDPNHPPVNKASWIRQYRPIIICRSTPEIISFFAVLNLFIQAFFRLCVLSFAMYQFYTNVSRWLDRLKWNKSNPTFDRYWHESNR